MYAIIDVGGKQYKAEEGKTVKVDLLEKNVGDSVEFKAVLVSDSNSKINVPSSAKVECKVLKHFKTAKVDVFKKQPKKGYKKMIGHRQDYTEVQIVKISA